jgi:hypothetical protein
MVGKNGVADRTTVQNMYSTLAMNGGFNVRFSACWKKPCDTPAVVTQRREAPEQYAQENDFDVDEILNTKYSGNLHAAKLMKLYAKLSCRTRPSCCCIPTLRHGSSYGVIPLRKALEIINAQNDPISESDFISFAEIVRHEKHSYCILGEEELYSDGRVSSPLDREIVENSLHALDLGVYDEMIDSQQGKPYFIPSKQELLLYADEDYYEPPQQSRAMQDYLRRQKKMTKAQTEEMMLEMQLYTSMGEKQFSIYNRPNDTHGV